MLEHVSPYTHNCGDSETVGIDCQQHLRGWVRQQGSTLTPGTGPPTAHEGDWYLYAEASGASNTDFVLELLPLMGNSTRVLELWYYSNHETPFLSK